MLDVNKKLKNSLKNYGISLNMFILFMLVLGLQMIFCSSCYARTTLTDEEAEYIYNYLFTTDYIDNPYVNFANASDYYSKSNYYQSGATAFKNFFNTHNTLDIDLGTTIFFHKKFSTNGTGGIYYGNFNTGYGSSNLPFLYLYFQPSDTTRVTINAIDDNKNIITNYSINSFTYINSGDSITFSTSSSITLPYYAFWINRNLNWNLNNINAGRSVLAPIDGVVSFVSTNEIYSNYNGRVSFDTPQPFLLQSYFNGNTPTPTLTPIPDGTITNSSGEITGSIDLSGIQNGIGTLNQSINNQGQAIIDNQNQNTQQIVNSINNSNENYWGSGDELDGDKQQNEISGYLNDITSNVSGELSTNQVYQQLNSLENGFLDFFNPNQPSEFYDLAFSWDDIEYNGTVIIPAANFNISQMCRDNETLSYVQSLIRIIFNMGCVGGIVVQIYNLILSTLGIDNPFLYEDYVSSDIVNADTGEIHSYIKRYRRVFKRRNRS